MPYLHGAFGERTASKTRSAAQVDEVVVYFGVAPIHLIRGYGEAGLINRPVRVRNLGEAQSKLGYSANWDAFSLCEVIDYHFNNTVKNAGPLYIFNVLDPAKHRKEEATTMEVSFVNGRGTIQSDTIILDTVAIENKMEGIDYVVEYSFTSGTATIINKNDEDPLDGAVSVTFNEVDYEAVTEADIIGEKTQSGEYSGIAALELLYEKENAIANIIAAPGWSDKPAVYRALVSKAQKINGHWDAFVVADIPLTDDSGNVDTIAKAIEWKAKNGYTSGISKVCWPQAKNGNNIYHLSTVCVATMLNTDNEHDAVPFESPSNKQIMATSQYFGIASTNRGYDQITANDLNEKGITTLIYWEGQFKLWGPHTAGFQYNGSMDAAEIFDVNMRMLMFCVNGFQKRNGVRIDSPMTPAERDSILVSEQAELDALKSIGALIGDPVIEFLENENPVNDMMNGDFVFHILTTPTPPMKSATVKVTYTDDGFQSFYEQED